MILCRDAAAECEKYHDKKIAVMAPKANLQSTPANVIKWFDAPEDASEYMHILYVRLHELDRVGADFILIETPPTGDAWNAVQDRLSRAAA